MRNFCKNVSFVQRTFICFYSFPFSIRDYQVIFLKKIFDRRRPLELSFFYRYPFRNRFLEDNKRFRKNSIEKRSRTSELFIMVGDRVSAEYYQRIFFLLSIENIKKSYFIRRPLEYLLFLQKTFLGDFQQFFFSQKTSSFCS